MKLFLLPLAALLVIFAPLAADTATIDQRIETLEQQLHTLRIRALNQEVHAQPLKVDAWGRYIDKIAEEEETEKQIATVKKEIEQLRAEKQAQQTPTPSDK